MANANTLKQRLGARTAAAQVTTTQAARTPAYQNPKNSPILNKILHPSFQRQMALALPKMISADRLTRIIQTEFRKTPTLEKCTESSVLGAILQCAAVGLEPGTALGHCYLLPYRQKDGSYQCQLIIGYRGMIDLARRSGQIVSIGAYAVREADEFSYELGLHPDIRHIPSPLAERGGITYVYAVANLKGGGVQFEVMSCAEIEQIRLTSKSGKSDKSPWANYWEEMAKKTVIRRLFKYLPVSIEAVRAINAEDREEAGEDVNAQQDFIDGEWIDKGYVPTFDQAPAQAPVAEPQPEAPAAAPQPEAQPQPAAVQTVENRAPEPPADAWAEDYAREAAKEAR